MAAPDRSLSARDRLNRIGHLFLSDDRRQCRFMLHARADIPGTLHAAALARALAGFGRIVAILEPEQGLVTQVRMSPIPDAFADARNLTEPAPLSGRPNGCSDSTGGVEIVIIASTPGGSVRTTPFVLLAVPAEAAGMRRAWLDLKALAMHGAPEAVGVTIVNAHAPEEAGRCFERFASAAQRFLGIEPVSYACLTSDEDRRGQELRNIAALLYAELGDGPPAAAATVNI